jgi:hypothetical protein
MLTKLARDDVTALEAARKLAEAHRMVEKARGLLARAKRRNTAPPHVFAGAWKRANAVLEKNREVLRCAHGVVGYGLGYRLKAGIETDEPCVAVFVRRKKSPRIMRKRGLAEIPKNLYDGKTNVGTDVVRLGRLEPHGAPGSIGPVGAPEFGTIGALARDVDTGERVAITAMHVSGRSSFGPVEFSTGVPFSTPGGSAENGRLVFGTTADVDAAKIVLEAPAAVLSPLPVAGVRPVSNDANAVVHLYGAVSGMQFGVVKYLNVAVLECGLIQTMLVDIETAKGDSGAGLVDESDYLLGFLYGFAPSDLGTGLRVFCPADLVMRTLRCSL